MLVGQEHSCTPRAPGDLAAASTSLAPAVADHFPRFAWPAIFLFPAGEFEVVEAFDWKQTDVLSKVLNTSRPSRLVVCA